MKIGKLLTRLCIIIFWVLVIFTALFIPSWHILPTEEKSINIFAWGDTLDPGILAEFEKESGIKVHLSFYATNEELQVKMKATKGQGYDLVMPSGYTVAILLKEDLLKPLDRNKLNFWDDLNPALLNHWFDLENHYSIPFEWEIFGLGVDKRFFTDQPFIPSWRAIYDPSVINYRIAIGNDPLEAVSFAALYLFGNTDSISQEQFQPIRQLLLEQRNWIEAYSDFRADYFIATGNCPVALSTSTYISRIRSIFPWIEFVIPKEGSFVTIENLCIPKASTKEKHVYQLLNYLYTKQSMIAHHESYRFFPATLSPIDEIEGESYEKELLNLSREEFNRFHFLKNLFPPQQMRDLWVEVKSF